MTTHIHHDIPKLERVTNSDGSRLYKTPSGAAYPSVTTITGLHKKQAIMENLNQILESTLHVDFYLNII
jgi:hypothetical protein